MSSFLSTLPHQSTSREPSESRENIQTRNDSLLGDSEEIPEMQGGGAAEFNETQEESSEEVGEVQPEEICCDFQPIDDIGMLKSLNSTFSEIRSAGFFHVDIIPQTCDKDGHICPKKLFSKLLSNGEELKRDWLFWSKSNQSFYCVPCRLLSKTKKSKLT